MTTGRSNSVASETRRIVSWNVERAPNNGRNCLGWTSREAGHSRVPAPPHMIRGMIRLSIGASNLVMFAIPRDKIANTILNRRAGTETNATHQITDIAEGFYHVPAAPAGASLPALSRMSQYPVGRVLPDSP